MVIKANGLDCRNRLISWLLVLAAKVPALMLIGFVAAPMAPPAFRPTDWAAMPPAPRMEPDAASSTVPFEEMVGRTVRVWTPFTTEVLVTCGRVMLPAA